MHIAPPLLVAAILLASAAWLDGCSKKEEAVSVAPPAAQPTPAPESTEQPAAVTPPTTAALPKRRCAAAGLAQFPWPNPPQPSVSAIVPPYLLFRSDGEATTLMAVAARLEGAIERAEYLQPKYLGAGCDGFAIVLDFENIEEDGTRRRGTAGFAPPSQDEGFSLARYIERLFYAPPGHYREIVFVVSDQRISQPTAPPTEARLRAIGRDGISSLPSAFASVPYTPQHVVLALIYEFDKGPRDGDVKVIPPEGRLGATVHLTKAHLF